MSNTLKHYRLNGEYKNLFANLASGNEFAQKELFNKPNVPSRTSYADMAEAEYHEKIVKALIDAGFIEVIDKGISALPKG